MTPMIDVVFQLLIFFICTASFQAIEETLPMGLADSAVIDAAGARQAEQEPARIVLQATSTNGRTIWRVNDQPVASLADVGRALRTATVADSSAPVTLDVAKTVPLGDMIDVYDLCRVTGLQKIEFAVEVP